MSTTSKPYARQWAEDIRRYAREANERRVQMALTPPPSTANASAITHMVDDYIKSIALWWSRVPNNRRIASYKIDEIVALAGLRSKDHEAPSASYVGKALRALGWTSRRDYSADGQRSWYWFPPPATTATTTSEKTR